MPHSFYPSLPYRDFGSHISGLINYSDPAHPSAIHAVTYTASYFHIVTIYWALFFTAPMFSAVNPSIAPADPLLVFL